MYLANAIASDGLKYGRNNLLQIFLIAFPLIGLVNFLRYLNEKDSHDGKIFFLMVILPFVIALLLFFTFVTLRLVKKLNNTISGIDFQEGKIFVVSSPFFGRKSKEYHLSSSEISIKETQFTWYGKKNLSGITLTINKNTQLFLVTDYFDDYKEILEQLNAAISASPK